MTWQIQHPFMEKALRQLRLQGPCLNLITCIYRELTADILLL